MLARHSTISLTLDRYTHLGIIDLQAALEQLPAVEPDCEKQESASPILRTGTDSAPIELGDAENSPDSAPEKVPTMVPRGAENGAVRVSSDTYQSASVCIEEAKSGGKKQQRPMAVTGPQGVVYCDDSPVKTADRSERRARDFRNRFS